MIALFAAMLAERRIIFTSQRLDSLSCCVQAANALLYPMVWQHIFIPILPLTMKEILCAPMPYLIGVPKAVLETVTLSSAPHFPISHFSNWNQLMNRFRWNCSRWRVKNWAKLSYWTVIINYWKHHLTMWKICRPNWCRSWKNNWIIRTSIWATGCHGYSYGFWFNWLAATGMPSSSRKARKSRGTGRHSSNRDHHIYDRFCATWWNCRYSSSSSRNDWTCWTPVWAFPMNSNWKRCGIRKMAEVASTTNNSSGMSKIEWVKRHLSYDSSLSYREICWQNKS